MDLRPHVPGLAALCRNCLIFYGLVLRRSTLTQGECPRCKERSHE